MILFRACKRQNVKKISPFEWRQAQSDTAVGNKNKIKHHRIPHNSKDLRHQRNPRALNPPDRTGLRNLCESVQSVGLKKNKLLIRTTN